MNLIQKSSVRKLVNSRECRISPDAFDGINRAVENLVDKMIANVKADGMKTLQTNIPEVLKPMKMLKPYMVENAKDVSG